MADMSSSNNNHALGNAYNAVDLGKKLAGLDALVTQVEQPLHQDRFQKVQVLLKKNNELIVQVMERQKEAAAAAPDQSAAAAAANGEEGEGMEEGEEGGEGKMGGGGGGGGNTATSEAQKGALQQCAVMIKELNDNLTQVYDVYAALQPTKDEN